MVLRIVFPRDCVQHFRSMWIWIVKKLRSTISWNNCVLMFIYSKPKGYNIVNRALANRQVVMEMLSIILANWPLPPCFSQQSVCCLRQEHIQSCRVAELQSYRFAKWHSCKVAELGSCGGTEFKVAGWGRVGDLGQACWACWWGPLGPSAAGLAVWMPWPSSLLSGNPQSLLPFAPPLGSRSNGD